MMESEFVKKKKEKKDESMDLSCLASMVQAAAGGVMLMGDHFVAHFGLFITNCTSF